jgi:hypothetical protein
LYISKHKPKTKTKKMNVQTLQVEGKDLNTNNPIVMRITASNLFMLVLKYQQKLTSNIWISNWQLVGNQGHSGSNHPINAGAYLHEVLEEITGEII